MKAEENKRMLALSYIVADLKAENIELEQRVYQLVNDYNDVVRQLDGKETRKDEDPARLLLDNMQKMRDHCDKLEKDNEQFSFKLNAMKQKPMPMSVSYRKKNCLSISLVLKHRSF